MKYTGDCQYYPRLANNTCKRVNYYTLSPTEENYNIDMIFFRKEIYR
jgi:hypothetical protein